MSGGFLWVTDLSFSCMQVDKAKFAENEFDREMLLGKTFAGGSNQAGLRSDR